MQQPWWQHPLEKIHSFDEGTKKTILVMATMVIMIIVVYVWIKYFNGIFPSH